MVSQLFSARPRGISNEDSRGMSWNWTNPLDSMHVQHEQIALNHCAFGILDLEAIVSQLGCVEDGCTKQAEMFVSDVEAWLGHYYKHNSCACIIFMHKDLFHPTSKPFCFSFPPT